MENGPVSPRPVRRWRGDYLPAYVGNGVLGLRVPRLALLDGVAVASGYSGIHPTDRVESLARIPYPLAGDITIQDAVLSRLPERATLEEQRYDFATGELHTRFRFAADERLALVEVLTLCSRSQPTIALQEITLTVDRACDVVIRAGIDPTGIQGNWLSREPMPTEGVDGVLSWSSYGDLAVLGAAYATELAGADADRSSEGGELERLSTSFSFRARAGRRYRLRQITSCVASSLHHQPDRQAIRLVYAAAERGFDALREDNRRIWDELWRGRVVLTGASRRWQALADAAFFYLHTSAHQSSPSSISMFGLSYWPDYHYYRGHVMWDIETFAVPPLVLTNPGAARALLEFRTERLPAARRNANLAGWAGAQFPWEASPQHGDEAAPDTGSAAAHEHHASADVAHAFAQFVHATGDLEFARTRAWPVLRDVADWIVSRATRTRRGYEIRNVGGVAEKEKLESNSAFVNIGAIIVLREAAELAERLDFQADARWRDVARRLVVPLDARRHVLRNYDGHRRSDEKGETPESAAALLLFGYDPGGDIESATFRDAIDHVDDYLGSPMLSALTGVFAARIGDRGRALELFERGYAEFILEPFTVTDEYSPAAFPEQTRAGPFTANLGGFLLSCLYGLTGLVPGAGDPDTWCRHPVSMPRGWRGVEVKRLFVRGRPARLSGRHGDERAQLEFLE